MCCERGWSEERDERTDQGNMELSTQWHNRAAAADCPMSLRFTVQLRGSNLPSQILPRSAWFTTIFKARTVSVIPHPIRACLEIERSLGQNSE